MVGVSMEKINLILSIVASLISIISAGVGINYYKKTKKIHLELENKFSNNTQFSGDNSTQIIGKKNKV